MPSMRLMLFCAAACFGCGSTTQGSREATAGSAAGGTAGAAGNNATAGTAGGGNGGSGATGGSAGSGASAAGGAGAAGAAANGFDLNDVSFLYPLPSWDERETLLAASTAGEHGPLLPRAVYEQVAPPLIETGNIPADLYASLHVLGVRVDPCFPGDASAQPACVKQIRLVLQPIQQDPMTSELTTLDGAVHALFALSDASWTQMVVELAALRELAGGLTAQQPLGVHPVLKAQGLTGSYASALRSLVLEYAGETTLSELAFMQLTKTDVSWNFTKVVKTGASFGGFIDVPLLAAKGQSASVNVLDAAADPARFVTVSPAPPNPWVALLADLGATASSAEASLREALLTDNPHSAKNPQTMDCGSCHLATRNRAYAERARGLDTSTWPERFAESGYDLRRVDDVADDPRSLRSFGYFGRKSSIAGRTIHESALVAKALSR